MRFGYSFWGFLGDHKQDAQHRELSTPDGNATYSWSIIHEAQRRGWTVYGMQEDRDWPAFQSFGKYNFQAFSQEKRFNCYLQMKPTFGERLPDLDVLLVEWRFPIPGRNCGESDGTTYTYDPKVHQPDYHRQLQMLTHYKSKGTKIILWDLDHKLTEHDERKWNPAAVFETSASPLRMFKERTRVEPPCVVSELLEHPTLPSDVNRKLIYIGSRYERDEVITRWIKPTSDAYPQQVEFWGNWLKTEEECKKLWPNVSFNDRITTKDFRRVYGTAGGVPLLAKRSYLETGFITPRPWEALMFGSLPIGLGEARGIGQYVEYIAHDGNDMIEVAETLAGADVKMRDEARRSNVERIEFMDVRHFLDKMEAVL